MKLLLALLAAIVIGAVVTTASAAIVSPYVANAFSHLADKAARCYQSRRDRPGQRATMMNIINTERTIAVAMMLTSQKCDDDDDGAGAGANPAPAGTVAPPANGLFGKGPAPSVQVH